MTDALHHALTLRSNHACELCASPDDLGAVAVPPRALTERTAVLLCASCQSQAQAEHLDEADWSGLKDAAWNVEPAVQVTCVRLLRRLKPAAWAVALLEQIYLPDEVRAWADETGEAPREGNEPTRDSNGATLADGDSVTLIKDLDVKGGGFTAKRGTLVKDIRLIEGDPDNIEGKVNKAVLVLKTKFLKKA